MQTGNKTSPAPMRAIDPTTLLAPLPAVLVSCAAPGREDAPNLLTIAWAGVVNSKPPMVSVSVRKERYSHDLIAESGEFVVNLAGEEIARALDWCGVKSGRDGDKFAACGIHAVRAPGLAHASAVAEAPAYLCCKVRHTLELGSHDMFIGEVVAVRVREEYFDADGSMHLERAKLLCYNHGLYQATGDVKGFFGWSVARPEVFEHRMAPYRR